MFITFEGLDGSGKTTQVALLAEAIREAGREVVATREPGGTPLGEQIREVLLGGDEIAPWTEAALFAAARAELADHVIAPALERGAVVISDRYLDSSLAYQGIARGLGIDRVLEFNLPVLHGQLPDKTYVLLVDPEESARRIGEGTDRIERQDPEFRKKVDEGYRLLVDLFPQRIEPVDGTQAPDDIARLIFGLIRQHL
ncbi:MAG: dTMP kinase [Actinomycetota bacterium]|nr:dTMP kinase [Actinomycetota bacterium]MDQ2982538.1 dTMP kinase [Actinomycetota bacterium]